MKLCIHPNIAKLFELYKDSENIFIVTEYC